MPSSRTTPTGPGWLDAPRVGLGEAARLSLAARLERLHRGRFVDVGDEVELRGDAGVEVVRDALGLRPVDHADRALESPAPARLPTCASGGAWFKHATSCL